MKKIILYIIFLFSMNLVLGNIFDDINNTFDDVVDVAANIVKGDFSGAANVINNTELAHGINDLSGSLSGSPTVSPSSVVNAYGGHIDFSKISMVNCSNNPIQQLYIKYTCSRSNRDSALVTLPFHTQFPDGLSEVNKILTNGGNVGFFVIFQNGMFGDTYDLSVTIYKYEEPLAVHEIGVYVFCDVKDQSGSFVTLSNKYDCEGLNITFKQSDKNEPVSVPLNDNFSFVLKSSSLNNNLKDVIAVYNNNAEPAIFESSKSLYTFSLHFQSINWKPYDGFGYADFINTTLNPDQVPSFLSTLTNADWNDGLIFYPVLYNESGVILVKDASTVTAKYCLLHVKKSDGTYLGVMKAFPNYSNFVSDSSNVVFLVNENDPVEGEGFSVLYGTPLKFISRGNPPIKNVGSKSTLNNLLDMMFSLTHH